MCVELVDKPGELARVFGVIAGAGINITYSYSLIATYIAFRVDSPEATEELLRNEGVRIIEQSELS